MANIYLSGVEKNNKLTDTVLVVEKSVIHPVKICIYEPGWYDEVFIRGFIKKNYNFVAKRWILGKKIKSVRFHPVANSKELGSPAEKKLPAKKAKVEELIIALNRDGLAAADVDYYSASVVKVRPMSGDGSPLAGFPRTQVTLLQNSAEFNTIYGTSYPRFSVGRINRDKVIQFGLVIPIGIDPAAQMKKARKSWHSRSTWIYDPPNACEFDTTFKEFQEVESNLKHSNVPIVLTFVRRSIFATKSDGGTNVPEAINARLQTKPSGEIVMNTPVLWAMDNTGGIAKNWVDRDDCDDTDMGIMYYGPGIAFRFSVKSPTNKNLVSIWDSGVPTVAYAVRNEWYVKCLKEFRPDLLPDWVPPPQTEKETLLFMGSDWCMRNDANQKRGTMGASVSGKQIIDIYSRPSKTLTRWVINAFRVKYQEATHCELPGVTIFKSTISHKDMQTVLAMVKAKKEKEAAAPLAMPVLHPQPQPAVVSAEPEKGV